MLNREQANIIRFVLDELLPPIIRENKYFMYPLLYIWFKGKNVKRFMEFKEKFHRLTEEEYAEYYRIYHDRGDGRKTSANKKSIEFILNTVEMCSAAAGGGKSLKIIDIGCGEGYILNQLYAKGYHNIQGIDVAPKSVSGNFVIEQGSVDHLPYADKSFDIVICTHVLEHVLDLGKAISELKRVAKDKIIIVVPRQRYYKYTFDLHIQFFPQASYLLQYFSDEKVHIEQLDGDWALSVQL